MNKTSGLVDIYQEVEKIRTIKKIFAALNSRHCYNTGEWKANKLHLFGTVLILLLSDKTIN
jgi:hypothetical protein